MPDNNFLVLKAESVQRLKKAVTAKPALIDSNFDELCDSLHLGFVSTNYLINTDLKLKTPVGIKQEENFDAENCRLILEIAPQLTPAQATDERLWVTLCFQAFGDYAQARWPFRTSDGEKYSNHIANHWFATGVRGRMRDNAVSRLWWMGYTATRIPEMSIDQVFAILFANSDYRSSLLERNSSANSLNVLVAILKVTDAAYKQGIEYKRESFRQFMSRVDTLGGRSNLAAMNGELLVKVFQPLYDECYATVAVKKLKS